MASFRFCRTDDIDLLVRAIHVGYSPYFLDEQMITTEDFKREVKEVGIWASSCMVVTDGADPFGVLIVARRDTSSLITRLGIHKDYRHNRYGAQLITSLRDKMAILGPPHLMVELPVEQKAYIEFFHKLDFVGPEEAMYTDYILPTAPENRELEPLLIDIEGDGLEEMGGRFLPNGLVESDLAWVRQSSTLINSPDTITGIGIVGMEGAEAYLFYTQGRNLPSHGLRATEYPENVIEILALGSRYPDKASVYFRNLLAHASRELKAKRFILPKLAKGEIAQATLDDLGFKKAGAYTRLSLTCGEARLPPGQRD